MYKVWVFAAGVLFLAAGAASAAQKVKVIDGDSIVVNGVEMRLEGIDAPEYHQVCYDADKKGYRCGIKARDYLLRLTAGKKVNCKKLSVDRYKRQVSVCYAGGRDLTAKWYQPAGPWLMTATLMTMSARKKKPKNSDGESGRENL